MSVSYQQPEPPAVVPYPDLGGGLNTRLDPHALQRNELAVSINLWSSYDNAIAKRPGSVALVTADGSIPGATAPLLCIQTCRFQNHTYLLVQDSVGNIYAAADDTTGTWTHLGAVSPNATFFTAAQMFNPTKQKQEVFICDGLSIPQTWIGPPSTTLAPVDTTPGHLPGKYNSATPITPQFVKTLGNNSHLFYSGEPTNPSAVYISDPFYPESFNNAAMQVTTDPLPGQYNPAVIGNNDGVEGGPITALESLASVMVVFKEGAIYAMVQTTLLGEVPAWQVIEVANATGCVAPRSVVRFSSFIAFLSIDGVYLTDGTTLQQISADVASYFDSSLTGFPAIITNRNLSIGVRHGMRLLLFFSTFFQPYCNMGMWFDFTKQSRFGNPLAGQISDMLVGGATALRGPNDSGNVAWLDNSVAVPVPVAAVREFGVGFGDGNGDIPIQTVVAGKADLFEDVFGSEAFVSQKQAQDAYALVEITQIEQFSQLDFFGKVIVDLNMPLARVIAQPIDVDAVGGLWNKNEWNVMRWGSSSTSLFSLMKIPLQNNARGYMLQIAIKERSIIPWVLIGYGVYLNKQKVGY